MARSRHRTARPTAVLPEVVTRNVVRFFIVQVPHEAIQAGFRLDFFLRLLVVGIGRFVEPLGFLAGVLADGFARCIQDFELGFGARFRHIFQIKINHRARWRVLPSPLGRMVLADSASLNAVGRPWRVEMNLLLHHFVAELAQRTHIIQNPERPPMRGDYKVVAFDHEIVYRGSRQIQFQRPPVRPIVEGNVDAVFGASIEQSALFGIFADGAHETAVGNSVGELRPGLAIVGGFVDIRLQIVVLMAIHRNVSGSCIQG